MYPCDICPWMVISGKKCISQLTSTWESKLDRVAQLMKWIKYYESCLKADKWLDQSEFNL